METATENTTRPTNETAALTFRDRAIPMAKLNVPVIRLHERKKNPMDKEWQNLATTDLAQIETWNKETPDANCGCVAKNAGVLFFESDEAGVIGRYQKETGETFKTFTVQSRKNRFHFYFLQTDLSRKIGNISQKELKFGSLRQHNAFVVSPLSIHPDSGEPYTIVRNESIILAPDRFIEWLVAQKGEQKKESVSSVDPGAKISEGGRNNALTSYAGKLRRDGLEPSEIEIILLRYNRENCVPPLPESEVKTIAWSIGKKEAGHVGPDVLIGGVAPGEPIVPPAPSPEQIEKQKRLQDLVDSTLDSSGDEPVEVDNIYPHWVWQNTLYQEFADFCGKGNLIPKELFIESARTYFGAICGHRFSPQEGRFYTFLLSKAGGLGKGTAMRALEDLFLGTGLRYRLNESSAFMNIGFAEAQFSSSPGMYNNGFSKQNRIFQIYDEATKLLEKFSIPNSGDSYLDDLNTLFEDATYIPALTKVVRKEGTEVQGSKHLSIIGGTTFEKWNSAFGKTSADGSGFFQRMNLVSCDETETVSEIEKFNFQTGKGLEIREKFLAKIMPLEYQTVSFEKTEDAKKLYDTWHNEFRKEHKDEPDEVKGRINVMVSRSCEHLAYMLAPTVPKNLESNGEPIRIVVDHPTMEKAIALGEYQYQVRSKHRPALGANDAAMIEDSIRLTLSARPNKSMGRRDLYRKSGSQKYGLYLFNKVIDLMKDEGYIDEGAKTNNKTKGRKGRVVFLVEGE